MSGKLYQDSNRFARVCALAACALVATACAPKQEEHAKMLSIGSEFQPYVENFYDAASDVGSSVVIDDLILQFGATPTMNETGVCEVTEDETPRISINKTIWDQLTAEDRQEVVFHEMGHCVLRRVHQNGEARDSSNHAIPDSIMYPYRIPGTTYMPNATYYHTELFAKRNQF